MDRLIALEVATEAAILVFGLVERVPTQYRPVADQAIRAGSSVALNLAEGQGRQGRDRSKHFRYSYGSALETTTAVKLLTGARVVDQAKASIALTRLDKAQALIWGLLRRS